MWNIGKQDEAVEHQNKAKPQISATMKIQPVNLKNEGADDGKDRNISVPREMCNDKGCDRQS